MVTTQGLGDKSPRLRRPRGLFTSLKTGENTLSCEAPSQTDGTGDKDSCNDNRDGADHRPTHDASTSPQRRSLGPSPPWATRRSTRTRSYDGGLRGQHR